MKNGKEEKETNKILNKWDIGAKLHERLLFT